MKNRSEYLYEITKSKKLIEDKGVINVYGIYIHNSDSRLAKNKGESCLIEDISPSLNEVKKLKNLMEELELSPLHLYDVVEDFLS